MRIVFSDHFYPPYDRAYDICISLLVESNAVGKNVSAHTSKVLVNQVTRKLENNVGGR